MKICIPVNEDNGMDSTVCAHFGSAPLFMVVNTETKECRAIENANRNHSHGMCAPLASLSGVELDGMAVGGIGAGALMKLQHAGIQVFLSECTTVKETVTEQKNGTLKLVTPGMACGGHGHRRGGCGH